MEAMRAHIALLTQHIAHLKNNQRTPEEIFWAYSVKSTYNAFITVLTFHLVTVALLMNVVAWTSMYGAFCLLELFVRFLFFLVKKCHFVTCLVGLFMYSSIGRTSHWLCRHLEALSFACCLALRAEPIVVVPEDAKKLESPSLRTPAIEMPVVKEEEEGNNHLVNTEQTAVVVETPCNTEDTTTIEFHKHTPSPIISTLPLKRKENNSVIHGRPQGRITPIVNKPDRSLAGQTKRSDRMRRIANKKQKNK